jgi:hypothetical protein
MRARACLRSPAQPSRDAHFSTSFSPTIPAKQVDGSGAAAAHDGVASARGVRPVAAPPRLVLRASRRPSVCLRSHLGPS